MNKINRNKYQNVCSKECIKLLPMEIRIELLSHYMGLELKWFMSTF
jgi:hypothetical protein